MKSTNSEIAIRVDITNPGEFFACCGLLELAYRHNTEVQGWFDDDRFFVSYPEHSAPVTFNEILRGLVDASVKTEVDDDKESPLLLGQPVAMRLDWWLGNDGKKNALKTWAGNQDSYKMVSKWESPVKEILDDEDPDPTRLFKRQDMVQGPYGFDTKFGWDALSVGFSLNEHGNYKKSQARPVIEMLGAIGLQRFAPYMDRETVRYSTWSEPLPPPVARLAAVGKLPGATNIILEADFRRRGSYKGLSAARVIRGEQDD